VALEDMDQMGVPDDLGELDGIEGPPPDLASIRPRWNPDQ